MDELAWYEHDLDVEYDMRQRGITDIDEYYKVLEREENGHKTNNK